MNFRRTFRTLKELLGFLPSGSQTDWVQIDQVDSFKPTIVLVSGFGATHRNLEAARKRFKKEGFNVFLLSLEWNDFSDLVKGFYPLSKKLSQLILNLRKKPKMSKSPIFIVAHSAGGLVARHYIQILGGSHYVSGLITLGTPHQGTWFALLGLMTHLLLKARCLLQMLPTSSFISEINKKEIPDNFPFISIYSKDDLLCPPSSARLSHQTYQGEKVKSIEIAGINHAGFLLNKGLHKQLAQVMRSNTEELTDNILAAIHS